MKKLRNYLLSEIQNRVPELRDVRMWNDQFANANNPEIIDNIEPPFDYPCCFVQIETEETRNVGLGIKYVDLIIRLRLGLEDYQTERENDFDFIDLVDAAINGMRGDETDTVQFSSLQEINTELDSDFNMINKPILSYKTTYTKVNAFTRKDAVIKAPPTELIINKSIE